MMDQNNRIGRRGALALLGGGAAAFALAPAQAKPASSKKIDFSSPAVRLKTYMMMRGALDERLVIGAASGLYYGVVDAKLTPLYGFTSATFARYRALASGGYEGVTEEQAYFTDASTGRWIKTFKNPYTGETVDVPTSRLGPNTIVITPDFKLELKRPIPGFQFEHNILAPEVRGDDVWITEVTETSAALPGGAPPFRYSESVILHARRSELESRKAKRVACETTFNGVVSWRPWLKMGNRPGHLLGIGAGTYGGTMETLPEGWLAATREHRPELLKNPAATLDPVWNAAS